MSRGQSGEPQAGQLNGQGVNLALATWTFAINFWAWNLIGPLSTTYTKAMSLSSTQAALLVATPILVGSVGRIPVGALTDRFGGRVMFTVVSLVSIVPVLLVAFAGSIDSYVAAAGFRVLPRNCAEPRSRSASRSSTPGTSRRAAVSRPASSVRHGRHRVVGVLHPAFRHLVRVRRRRTSSSPSRWR